MSMNGTGVERILPQRDAALGHPKAKALDHEKFQLIEAVYRVIVTLLPAFSTVSLEQRTSKLRDYYQQQTRQAQHFYTLDESDDSDIEDEQLLKSAGRTSRKHRLEHRGELLQDEEIWKRTKRTTAQSKGLVDKLPHAISDPANIATNLKTVQDMLKSNHQKRATLPEFADDHGGAEFVALYRGNNYMSDRWTTPARREHYQTDETHQPQFSEAALKEGLEADFYTQLSTDTNPYKNPGLMDRLTELAEKVRTSYAHLYSKTYRVKETVSPSKITPYVFNHYADWMQHEFSNGINRHLLTIKERLTKKYWQECFVNSYNYALATGNRPYHSLKYALGAKEYYPYAFPLRYNADGSLLNCHAGKIYIILIPKETFLRQTHINRVVPKNYMGQVPIGLRILPELETSFIGAIPGEQVVYQEPLKFPSFNKAWADVQRVYAIKYGFDQTLYTQFQTLIKQTHIGSPDRDAVLNLLKEWLCAFHEVMLLRIAENIAAERDGRLVYIDHDDNSVNLPDKNPKTNGGLNAEQRNRVTLLERLRGVIGQQLAGKPRPANIFVFIEKKLADDSFLDFLRYGTDVTTNTDARRLLAHWQTTFQLMPITHPITKAISDPNNISLPTVHYSDQHIAVLLKHTLEKTPHHHSVKAMLPFVVGEFIEEKQRRCIIKLNKAIESILQKKARVFVIPINTSTTEVTHWHYNAGAWIGLILSFKMGRLQIQLHDPSNTCPGYVGDLEDYPAEQMIPIVELLQHIIIPKGTQNRFLYYGRQQEGGCHSGAWLVDSVALITHGKSARTNRDIKTQTLRNDHLLLLP